MLKATKPLTIIFVFCILALQLWLVFSLELFGDEAFYWLEGQNLDWSYAELPGWTAWMIRLGTSIFGNQYSAVRLFSYLSFLSCFYASYLLGKEFGVSYKKIILLLSVPLFVIISTMALPDIWLAFFVLWMSYFFVKASTYNKNQDWIILGILLALSLNVHVRMWIWLFFAGIAFVVLYYKNVNVLGKALTISLPIGLFGLLPIMYFNFNQDFALFTFQFGRRHPWEFQLSNLNFILSQFIVITPVVIFVWFKGLMQIRKQSQAVKWLLLTALLHTVFYLVTTLFADGLRTTVHWLLISYLPVLVLVPYLLPKNKGLINGAMISGGITSLVLLALLVFNKEETSNIQARILDNSIGWKKLSQIVNTNLKLLGTNNLVADYFMTAAELAFELDLVKGIKVLPHEKSIKHGRQKQLQIMGMLLKEPQNYTKKALLVIEDSTLKLKNKGKYYAQLCSYFPQMKYMQTVNIGQSNKQFHLFKINDGLGCEIPPFFYVNIESKENQVIISGWVTLDKIGIKSLSIISSDEVLINNNNIENLGIKQQFPEINDPNSPQNGFEIKLELAKIKNNQLRIKALGNNGRVYYSPVYYLN